MVSRSSLKIGDYVAIEVGKIIGFTSEGKAVVEFPSEPDDLMAWDTEDLFLLSSSIDPSLDSSSPEFIKDEEFREQLRNKHTLMKEMPSKA